MSEPTTKAIRHAEGGSYMVPLKYATTRTGLPGASERVVSIVRARDAIRMAAAEARQQERDRIAAVVGALERIVMIADGLDTRQPLIGPYRQEVIAIAKEALAAIEGASDAE